jgi:transglutaminase-like putative cysteine protease
MTTTRRRISTRSPRLDVILVALLAVIAAIPFGRLFYGYGFIGALAAGAAVPVLASWARRGRSWSWTFALSLFGLVLVMGFLVFHAGFAPSAWRAAWNGFTSGWSNLLTVSTPAVASPTLIAVPVFLTWAASFAGIELAWRTKLSALPILPPFVVLVVALAFAGSRPAGSFVFATALVLVVFAILVVRAHDVGSRSASVVGHIPMGGRARSALAGPGVVVVVGLVAVAIGPLLVGGDSRRFDLREKYRRPISLSGAVTPFALINASINDPNQAPIFTVQFSGVPKEVKIDRVPVALLDQYDGSVWGTDAEFTPAGRDLPPGPATDAKTVRIRQTYRITTRFPTPFLPTLERPETLSGASLGFDRQSGMVVSAAGAADNLSYSVVSSYPTYTAAEEVAAAHRGNDAATAALLLPPPAGWTKAIESFKSQYAAGKDILARLKSLVDEFQSDRFGYSTLAPPGQSLGVLNNFLSPVTGNKQTYDNRLGSAQQFAAAFAVLARTLNVPSRVVVGYKLDPTAVRAGRPIAVHPRDIHAWVEVHLSGLGWVPFDPTNTTNRKPVQTPQAPPNTHLEVPNQGNAAQTPTQPTILPPKHLRHHHSLLPWLKVALALLLIVPTGIVLAKRAIREFRRRFGGPAQRTFGAWLHTRDQLRVHHVPATRSMTARQVSDGVMEGDAHLGEQIGAFGPIIDNALYGPAEPTDESVDAAWHLADMVGTTLRTGSSPPERLLAAIDPRPLLQLVDRGHK